MARYFPPLTVPLAAALVGVQPGTIRQWRHRGYLKPVGGTARHPLYAAADVIRVAEERAKSHVSAAA